MINKPKVAPPSAPDVKLPIVALMLPTPPESMISGQPFKNMATVLITMKVSQMWLSAHGNTDLAW
jgi:hypothetical protein